MDLYINSFEGPNLKNGQMAELIRFTTRSNNCCSIGDRIPAIFTDKRGYIQIGTQIGNQGNKVKNVNINAKSWYRLDIMQYIWTNKVGHIGLLMRTIALINNTLVLLWDEAQWGKDMEIGKFQSSNIQQSQGLGCWSSPCISSRWCLHQKSFVWKHRYLLSICKDLKLLTDLGLKSL